MLFKILYFYVLRFFFYAQTLWIAVKELHWRFYSFFIIYINNIRHSANQVHIAYIFQRFGMRGLNSCDIIFI